MMRLSLTGLLIVSCTFLAQAQEVWSLQRCIQYARQNSLTLKQADYAIQNAQLTADQVVQNRYPNLSGSVSGGVQLGRTIDPTTNEFDNQTIGFSSLGLNAGWTLYNGGRINNTIKQAGVDVDVAKTDAEAAFNDIALAIANAYLQTLLGQEQLANAQARLVLTQQQLEQTDKLIRAGSLPANARLEILAQAARNQQTIVQAENTVTLGYLDLKQLLELDPDYAMELEVPEVIIPTSADPRGMRFAEIYSAALGTQPQIRANELRKTSALIGIDLARANQLPSLGLGAGLNSNWSSQGRTILGFTTTQVPFTLFDPDGNPLNFTIPQQSPNFEKQGFFNQIEENFGQFINLRLSVPIYSNGLTQTAIDRAELNILNLQVQADQTKQQLKSNVMRAIADARAQQRNLAAAEATLEAAEAAFRNAERRFELGAINTFDLTNARNNFDSAEIDLTAAKYQYLFALKIVDFYRGTTLRLD